MLNILTKLQATTGVETLLYMHSIQVYFKFPILFGSWFCIGNHFFKNNHQNSYIVGSLSRLSKKANLEVSLAVLKCEIFTICPVRVRKSFALSVILFCLNWMAWNAYTERGYCNRYWVRIFNLLPLDCLTCTTPAERLKLWSILIILQGAG